LAVFAQAVFFIISGGVILFVSVKKLIQGHVIHDYQYGLTSMLLCVFIGFVLLGYQSYVIAKTDSDIIKADKIHYVSDFATNVAVIISILTSKYYHKIDPIFGIFISVYITYSSTVIMRKAIRNLIDEEFSSIDKDKVLQVLSNNAQILGVHDLKTRRAGDKAFIQMHIDLEASISLIDAHKISQDIETKLLEIFPNGEVIIHQDPIGHDEPIERRENIGVKQRRSQGLS
jgi:cation diffusion facilitator family transporter